MDPHPRQRISTGRFCLAILLWVWSTIPLAQLVTLWRWHYSPEAVPEYRLYAAQPAELTRYYVRLIWGAMVLSFAGPALIWSLPRRFTRWAGTTFLLALLFLLIGA